MITTITRAASEVGRIGGYATPAAFARDEVSFAHDVSASRERFDPALTPYLMPILEQWDFRGHGQREVVVMAVEQTGKSLSWQLGLLWSFIYEPGLSMVVYPSDDKCDEINRAKLQPLMRSVPSLAAGLAQSNSKARNRYNFPAFISYFQGAVERISAHSARIRIADEVDDWQETEGRTESPKLEDLRKRGRTFPDAMLSICSSPKGNSPIIEPEFRKTSMGYWHLRCCGCGNLTMRSADVHHLQFETTEDAAGEKQLVLGSERLICPVCKREHVYAEARDMNMAGEYIHREPGLVGKRTGFQWGALASQWAALDWTYIAEKQLNASARANPRDQANFDNSIRGLPFRPRRIDAPAVTAIRSHCAPAPAVEDIEGVFMSADSQDVTFFYTIIALLKNESMAVLAYGRADTVTDLDAVYTAEYMGIKPMMGIVDSGGHRGLEVSKFCAGHRGTLEYKGNSKIGRRHTISRENPRLLLAMPLTYQAELLYYLFTQDSREKTYLFLPETVSDEFVAQLSAVKENAKVRGGDQYERWVATGDDHWFDSIKMGLALLDYAKRNVEGKHFKSGSPVWTTKRREVRLKPKGQARAGSWLKG